jgi:hypothetical protein
MLKYTWQFGNVYFDNVELVTWECGLDKVVKSSSQNNQKKKLAMLIWQFGKVNLVNK